MFCSNCGKKAQEGRFCSECGKELVVTGQVQEASSVADSEKVLPTENSPNDDRRWWEKKRFAIPIISVLLIGAVGSLSEEESPTVGEAGADGADGDSGGVLASERTPDDTSQSGERTLEQKAEGVDGVSSEVQSEFIETFESYLELYDNARTELQAANFLNERDSLLCQITDQGQVADWVGTVKKVGANGEGKAVLEVEVHPNLVLKTWNNALSDAGDGTLISPSSALFSSVLPLEGGETVVFSGRFVGGSNHCLKDSRFTDYGRANDPNFIFKFRALDVIG